MQFKVPQNIDMQDRILGPLTLFQLLFLLIGFLIVYGLFRTGSILLFVFVGIPLGLILLALAFVKINEQPFGKFLIAFVLFELRPKTRLWHKGGQLPKVSVNAINNKSVGVVTPKKFNRQTFSDAAQRLDQK